VSVSRCVNRCWKIEPHVKQRHQFSLAREYLSHLLPITHPGLNVSGEPEPGPQTGDGRRKRIRDPYKFPRDKLLKRLSSLPAHSMSLDNGNFLFVLCEHEQLVTTDRCHAHTSSQPGYGGFVYRYIDNNVTSVIRTSDTLQ
jgi:hypothetical protein